MKHLSQRYVQYINHTYQHNGTLWEGRFRSCLVQNGGDLLSYYRDLFVSPVDPELVAEIRSATNGNYALGNDRFKSEIEQMVKRCVPKGKPGRPAKSERNRGLSPFIDTVVSLNLDPHRFV